MDEIERNEADSHFLLKRTLFLARIKIEQIPVKVWDTSTACHALFSRPISRCNFAFSLFILSYYDISLLYSRIHLKWISLCYCANSWCQNYLRVDLTLKSTPPPIFLDPVYRSGSTILLHYLKTLL
jgi:hypothetical protein